MNNLKNISTLKFWCQKVLPIVYDDSLSYYELLCKVVHKLNEVIDNENALNDELKNFLSKFSYELYKTISTIIDELLQEGAFQNIVRAYSQTSVNDEFYRYWVADMARGYIEHYSEFVYGGQHAAFRPSVVQIGGKWQINCSTFGVLLSCGISFDNSKYGGGQNTRNELGLNDDAFIEWFSSPKPGTTGEQDEDWNYTYNIAERMYKEGKTFYPEKDLSNVQTGDLLFLALEPDPGVVDPFMGITHCAIFAYKANDNIYAVWEVGSAGPVEAKYPISYANEKLVLCGRFPYKQSQIFDNNNLITNGQTEYTSTSAILRACTPIKGVFKANKQYTLVAKIIYDYPLPDVYPGIDDNNDTRLASDYSATKRPDDDVYTVPFSPVEDSDFIYLKTIVKQTGLPQNAKCEWCAVYEGLALYRKDIPKQFTRNISVSNKTGFSTTLSPYYDYNKVTLFAQITGNFTAGNNNVATLQNVRVTTLIQPLTCIMVLTDTGATDCTGFIDNRGDTSDIHVIIPEGQIPESVFVQITLPTTYSEM